MVAFICWPGFLNKNLGEEAKEQLLFQLLQQVHVVFVAVLLVVQHLATLSLGTFAKLQWEKDECNDCYCQNPNPTTNQPNLT